MENKLTEVTGQYSNDSRLCTTKPSMHVTDRTPERFESRKGECHNINFAGIWIITKPFGFCLNQAH